MSLISYFSGSLVTVALVLPLKVYIHKKIKTLSSVQKLISVDEITENEVAEREFPFTAPWCSGWHS